MRNDLSRRFLDAGLIEDSELEAALFLAWMREIHVLRALVERGSVHERQIVEEASRLGQLPMRQVTPASDLVARLPPGTCRRLFAVPTRVDAISGVIDAAALDPFDTHVAAELGFHLGGPVRLRSAPLGLLEESIRSLDPPPPPLRRLRHITPAFPHGAPNSSLPPAPPDETPIPLLRKLSPPRGVPAIEARPPSSRDGSARDGAPRESAREAVDPGPPAHAVGPHAGPSRGSVPPPATMRGVLRALGVAGSRDEIVRQLLRGARLFARRVAVFVARRDGLHGWACNDSFGDAAALRRVVIPHGVPSVLATAVAAGTYRGPLVRSDVRAGIPPADGDVLAVPILVHGRPAMVLLAASLGEDGPPPGRPADEHQVDESLAALAESAGEALARVLSAPTSS